MERWLTKQMANIVPQPEEVKQAFYELLEDPTIDKLARMGLWLPAARGGRAKDTAKLRVDSVKEDGIYWRTGKSIKKPSQRKNVRLPDDMLEKIPRAPMSFEEWWSYGASARPLEKAFSAEVANAALKRVKCAPHLTSESIRDVFHRLAFEKTDHDYQAATRYTVHQPDSKFFVI